MPSINDLDTCQRVALMRRGGVPDTMIASELGVTVERLRSVCPASDSNPLGFPGQPEPSHPSQRRGHDSAPLDLTPSPYSRPPDGGSGGALLLLLFLLVD